MRWKTVFDHLNIPYSIFYGQRLGHYSYYQQTSIEIENGLKPGVTSVMLLVIGFKPLHVPLHVRANELLTITSVTQGKPGV